MRIALALLFAISAEAQLCRESLTGIHCRSVDTNGVVVWRVARHEGRGTSAVPSFVPRHFAVAQPALVFDPNPVAAINDPSLMDNNDSPTAVPAHAYETVSVDLLGPHARVVDVQAPFTTEPDPNAPLMFDRGDDRFEPVNAYFHVDRMQRHLQSLGYAGSRQLVAYPIDIDALALNGADGSQFRPSLQIGRGSLFFGTGGTDDAEDADLVVHEYGHAILEWIAPGTFGGATLSSESRAFAEGFCDYLAFSVHYEARVASGRDPFCFADWDARCWTDLASEGCAYPAGSDCLRRLDSPRTMADYSRSDTSGVEHRNGQIWSSALREIYLKLGRRTTDLLVLESLFAPPPHPTYAVMARRLIDADRLLFNGPNVATICAAMTARGIGVSCDGTPRGELTHVPSRDSGVVIPDLNPFGITSTIEVTDTRAIERLAVRLDLQHTARGDLRIELEAPDGTRVLLQNVSVDITRDIHVTYGVDAVSAESLDRFRGLSAAGTWRLHIADLRSRDAGTLQSWSLVLQLAGDEPLATRPRAAKTQMIPVVAHLFGANLETFTSDVYLANVTASEQLATLIFTRSHADGTTDFGAVDVQLAPGQSASFEDVVSRTFFTTGSGSLEVLGDVLVTSRMENGRHLGQEVPATLRPVLEGVQVAGMPLAGSRYNLGITEVAGRRARVFLIERASLRELTIEPWSHVQIPGVNGALLNAEGSVVAYVSQVEPSGDAMFIPAARVPVAVTHVAPAISAISGGGGVWRTDLWTRNPIDARYRGVLRQLGAGVHVDLVREVFALPGTSGSLTTSTAGNLRITQGETSQFIPLRELDDRREQHLIGLSNDATRRTNIGIVTDGFAIAEAVVFDAAGTEIERLMLVTDHGLAQVPIAASIHGGRALVRHLAGDRIRAYASVIDRRSGDAAFVDGQ